MMGPGISWNEDLIAGALAHQLLNNKALVVVPRCKWTGHECDILAVTQDLRIVDIEIKISVRDLKADAKKDKWWHDWDWQIDGPYQGRKHQIENRRARTLPHKVWKHYFAVPEEIWDDSLVGFLPSQNCGVIKLWDSGRIGHQNRILARVHRRAKPARDYETISEAAAIDIARLASLRMWNMAARLDRVNVG